MRRGDIVDQRLQRLAATPAVAMTADTMSLAKALSLGYQPISAVLIPEFMYEALAEAGDSLGVFGHGYTYSGHPVGAAVALKNLELIEERNLVGHAARVGERFQSWLRAFAEHPLVGEARGVGLIVRALGNDTIAFCPPLIISEAEIDDLFGRFTQALDETLAWAATQVAIAC